MARAQLPLSLALLMAVGALSGAASHAQTAPVGSEFQVNSYTTNFQYQAAVATDPHGDFIVLWASIGSSANDDSDRSIQGQRYDTTGNPIGAQFEVNSYTTGKQYQPAVATDSDGDFVVVWTSFGSGGTDTTQRSLQGQRYDAAGDPIGAQFQVNSYTTGPQRDPDVAADPDGDFVVVWQSLGSGGTDTSSYSIQGQRYDAAGLPIGYQFQVNSYTSNLQRLPVVATDPDGNSIVVWHSYGSGESDTIDYSIQGQRYDAVGSPIGGQFQVNSYTPGIQQRAAVAASPDGGFVVVWDSDGSGGSDTSGVSIQGQRYDAAGDPIGTQFQVNSYTTNFQHTPAVATDPDGDFVVVWDSEGSSSTDSSARSIQGQRYRVTGDLGDLVFFDRDFDGIQDSEEIGLANVSVHLFDSFGALVRSTTTDASGLYHFKPKADREFYLQFDLPPDQSFAPMDRGADDALDSDADVLTGLTDMLSVALLATDLTWDAGMANGVGDRVWLDLDGDGVQDAGEPGYGPGVPVELVSEPAASSAATTTTGVDGRYTFPSVSPDDYTLKVVAPAGVSFSPPNTGANDHVDSDVDPLDGSTDPFTLSLGDLDLTRDAGLTTSNTIGDRIWLDANENGLQDAGEPGWSGVTVNLRDTGGAVLETASTDANGFFGFTPVLGIYILEVVPPTDFAFTERDQGPNDAADSDVDPATGFTPFFTILPGTHDLAWDAGLVPLPIFADGFESGDTKAWSAMVP